ncbi:phospholipid scramblase family member 5-like [Lissotriton helveticus]
MNYQGHVAQYPGPSAQQYHADPFQGAVQYQANPSPGAVHYQPQYQPQGYQHANAGQPQAHPVPGPQNFMPAPYMATDLPPGLEYLTQVDQLLINQKRQRTFRTLSEYEILNAATQRIFHAKEERECWGPRFDIKIYDNAQRAVLHALLPRNYCSCEDELEVYSPTSGGLIGSVIKRWDPFSSSFSILNSAKEALLKVVGPGATMAAFRDVNFEVKTSKESLTVGRIARVWRGLRSELLSYDHYSVQFPLDLDAKVKALLLATGLYIDYLYYEPSSQNNNSASSPVPGLRLHI